RRPGSRCSRSPRACRAPRTGRRAGTGFASPSASPRVIASVPRDARARATSLPQRARRDAPRSGPAPVGEAPPEFRKLRRDDHAAIALRRIVLVEALVVGLGRVVRPAALDPGDDGRIEDPLGLQRRDDLARDSGLLLVLGED